MTLLVSKLVCILFLLCICTFLYFLQWEHLSNVTQWIAFPTQAREWGTTKEEGMKQHFTTSKKSSVTSQTPESPIPILYKDNFTAYPLWDFENVYSLKSTPWPTNVGCINADQCFGLKLSLSKKAATDGLYEMYEDFGRVLSKETCVRSLHNSKNESFMKDFLPNTRLFLHKDDINVSEWNRLSHFNGPFGFMECEYNEMMASIKLIPKPEEPLLRPKAGGDGCVSCAVVGAGGILNGSKMGAQIDAHDYVFRVNGAVVRGFEEDVGSRTSVYVHTSYSLIDSIRRLRQHGFTSAPQDEGIKYVIIPEGLRDFQWTEALLTGHKVYAGEFINYMPSEHYPTQFNQSNFYVLHPDFLRYVRNRFIKSNDLNTKHWAIIRPTNGAFTIFLALHSCDTVDAYGFMTDNYMKYSNYYVDKTTKTNVIFYLNHDYILEKTLWQRLHNSNIIKLFQRN